MLKRRFHQKFSSEKPKECKHGNVVIAGSFGSRNESTGQDLKPYPLANGTAIKNPVSSPLSL